MTQRIKVATLATLLVATLAVTSSDLLASGPTGSDARVRNPEPVAGGGPAVRGPVQPLLDLLEQLGIHYVKPSCEACMKDRLSGDSTSQTESTDQQDTRPLNDMTKRD